MSGFWSEALLSVQAKLDAKTESAKERLSSLKETVAATVESAQERIAADIESLKEEHARFIAEQDGDGGSAAASAADIKALVLGLSRDEATFTRPPPAEATYAFPFARRTALILELLELDPALKKAHTKLAHKAKEETFFTNYFYRVAEREPARRRRRRPNNPAAAAARAAAVAADGASASAREGAPPLVKFRAPSESSATDSAVLINASEAASEFSSLVHVEDDDPASPRRAPDDALALGRAVPTTTPSTPPSSRRSRTSRSATTTTTTSSARSPRSSTA
ncbi:hypothetical protein JL721_11064 [Aureococcus anophagefferens]|nr:hypothetical protein JL721_11064 [Aureococcus anophagefferens]